MKTAINYIIDELDTNTINIDEVIKYLFATGAVEDEDEAKNAVNSALEVIEELKLINKEVNWWRGQDLIKRTDAIYTFRDTGFAISRIREIPKAEYRDNE